MCVRVCVCEFARVAHTHALFSCDGRPCLLNKGDELPPLSLPHEQAGVFCFALNLTRRHLGDIKLLSASLLSAANEAQGRTPSWRRYSLPLTAPFL